ncbi:hypothetical protein M8C21_027623, partial [Ambrosia artemisiifolia]
EEDAVEEVHEITHRVFLDVDIHKQRSHELLERIGSVDKFVFGHPSLYSSACVGRESGRFRVCSHLHMSICVGCVPLYS